jgi:hypothetical protein
MKFCIIGDSWTGWGSVQKPPPPQKDMPYLAPIDNYLIKHGHTVSKNTSAGGASNFGQLQMLEYQADFTKFDCIIWMYTEPARNLTEFADTYQFAKQYPDITRKNFYKDMDYVQTQDFKCAQRLYETYKKPFIVIGGAGKINKLDVDYPFIQQVLPNWNQLLCGLENMPVNCYFHHVATLLESPSFNYNKAEILEEIENLEQLAQLMKNNKELYYDEFHPSMHLYGEMLEKLLKLS